MSFDDELLQDAQHDEQVVAYIKQHLPQEMQEKLKDDELYYFLDLTEDYFAESEILEAQPDAEGYVEIDLEQVANYLVKQAKKENMGDYNQEDLLFFVQALIDFDEDVED